MNKYKDQKKMASLAEVNATVDTTQTTGVWRKLFAFFGPAYLISVGYMDPGNWATDIAGGSQYGYALIWVLLLSNLIALLLQSLSARLGVVRGRDLAQASREVYPRFINLYLYVLAEIAIAACDLAEVLGMSIGLELLFNIPLIYAVCFTVLDTFLLLFLLRYGMRKLEAFIISLVAVIGLCFITELFFSNPDMGGIAKGFIPSLPGNTALYIAIGIIGATVMPHNLYLHSSLVQSRNFKRTDKAIKTAIKYNFIDSAIALNLAFLVNSAILILAASAFFNNGIFNVAQIEDAHKLLAPLLGTQLAPVLFAVALIAAGQASTVTGTLAGQVVMEGYLNLRIQPWIRRLMTRIIAIVPALISIATLGEGSTGNLLVLSQVILSLQLGFAIIPLIHFVSDKQKMGAYAINPILKILAWLCAAIIIALNARLIFQTVTDWLSNPATNHFIIISIVIPLIVLAGIILLYIIIQPFVKKQKRIVPAIPHGSGAQIKPIIPQKYKRIAIAVDFSENDAHSIQHALSLGDKEADYVFIHIVESVGAVLFGKEINDYETVEDENNLKKYADEIENMGYKSSYIIGFGDPKKQIPEKVKQFDADLLVLGAHGHTGLRDIIFGTTVNAVRHKLSIPVLIIR